VKAAGCIACGLILISAACVWCAMNGPGTSRIRNAIIRARWAWACRKPPARAEGKLTRAEHRTFVGLVETWRQSGAPERTRT
jgi:hypothetical protein